MMQAGGGEWAVTEESVEELNKLGKNMEDTVGRLSTVFDSLQGVFEENESGFGVHSVSIKILLEGLQTLNEDTSKTVRKLCFKALKSAALREEHIEKNRYHADRKGGLSEGGAVGAGMAEASGMAVGLAGTASGGGGMPGKKPQMPGMNYGMEPKGKMPRDLPVSQYGYQKTEDGTFVYDSPMGTDQYLYKTQGKVDWRYKGTCGLCSCCNILRLAGVDVSEKDMIEYASKEKLCVTGLNILRNGATDALDRKEILDHFGINSGVQNLMLMPNGKPGSENIRLIEQYVSAGKGVILSVHADMLWKDAPYGKNDYHAVVVTSVKKDKAGNIQGFYICDSEKGGTKYYPAQKILDVLTGSPMNVIHQIIR